MTTATAFGRTTVTNPPALVAGMAPTTGIVTFDVPRPDLLGFGPARVFKQQGGRYDPDDPDFGTLIYITAKSGSTITAYFTQWPSARAIEASMFVLMQGEQPVSAQALGATGDGVTDDSAAILRAVAVAAVAPIKRVYLGAGTFIYDGLMTLASNVTLTGDGPGVTTIKRKAGSTEDFLIGLTNTNAHVTHLTMDGNHANVVQASIICEIGMSGTRCSVEDVEFVRHTSMAISPSGSTDCKVLNCTITGTGSTVVTGGTVYGITNAAAAAFTNLLIQGCTITGHVDNGVWLWGTFKVIGNTFYGNNTATASGGGQIASYSHALTGGVIADNDIGLGGTPGSTGIEVSGEAGLLISNNRITAQSHCGIQLHGDALRVSVIGNTIKNCGWTLGGPGILVQGNNCTIRDNTCYDDQTPKIQPYGIVIDSGTTGNLVEHNNLAGNLTGGLLNSAAALANTVRRNTAGTARVIVKGDNYTITDDDVLSDVVFYVTAAATIKLPLAVRTNSEITVVHTSAGTVTVVGSDSDAATISLKGGTTPASVDLVANFDRVILVSDGTNWLELSGV